MDHLVSQGGRFTLAMQSDGNLVIYDGKAGGPIWSSGTAIVGPDPGPGPEPGPVTDRRILRANFCNLTDSTGRPIFSSSLAAQSPAMQAEWIGREIDAGGTHYMMSVQTGYKFQGGDPAWGYQDEIHFYRAGRFGEFLEAVDRVLGAKLIPTVFLDSGGPYPGSPFLAELVNAFPASYRDVLDWVLAWEPVKGDWLSEELSRAARTVRGILGPSPILLCHLSQGRGSGASNPEEDGDPWKGAEGGFWFEHGGEDFDGFLYQSIVPMGGGHDATNHFGELVWQERGIEIAERFLPPGTPMPGALGFKVEGEKDANGIPELRVHNGLAGYHSWFGANGNGRARGLPPITWSEATAYTYIRKQSDEAWARDVATFAKSIGFQGFGNGLPLS